MSNKLTLSGLDIENFRTTIDGKESRLYILTNHNGCELTICNYGARIVSLLVPDRNGEMTDVVTGHSSIADYLTTEEPYFGVVCGRYANRIARGRFEIDGKVYDKLAINNGPNSLHGGLRGFHFRAWEWERIDDQAIRLSYTSADGEEGYPGEVKASVTTRLTDDNAVVLDYEATTTRPTVINLTNHSYFNLSGEGDRSVGDHLLEINADHYLPTDETAIPLGPLAPVEGTPMDFRAPHTIGERIGEPFQQLIYGKGYDHCYALNRAGDGLTLAARCRSPKSGIRMETYTTEPGVQLYTANWLSDSIIGKHGHPYPERCAFCLETQHFPDSPNRPEYPPTVLRPGETYRSQTVYRFSADGQA